MFGEELHYYIQNELGDDTPVKFNQERIDRIKDRIEDREEMDPTEWRKKVIDEMIDKWAEDSTAMAKDWDTSSHSDKLTDKEDGS